MEKLHKYLTEVGGVMSLFDVPLHNNLYNASINPEFDMSKLLDHTLVKENPLKAVTFVDNHDTQPRSSFTKFRTALVKAISLFYYIT